MPEIYSFTYDSTTISMKSPPWYMKIPDIEGEYRNHVHHLADMSFDEVPLGDSPDRITVTGVYLPYEDTAVGNFLESPIAWRKAKGKSGTLKSGRYTYGTVRLIRFSFRGRDGYTMENVDVHIPEAFDVRLEFVQSTPDSTKGMKYTPSATPGEGGSSPLTPVV